MLRRLCVASILVVGSLVAGAGHALAEDGSLLEFGSGRIASPRQYAMLVLLVSLTSFGLFVLAG